MNESRIVETLEDIANKLSNIESILMDLLDGSLNKALTEEEFVRKYAPEIYANIEDIDASGAVSSAISLYEEIEMYVEKKRKSKE